MHRKNILLLAGSLELAETERRILPSMDVTVYTAGVTDYANVLTSQKVDLVIADLGLDIIHELPRIEHVLTDDQPVSLLVVATREMLAEVRLPARLTSDFIMRDACDEEYIARTHRLLWPGEEATNADLVRVDGLTINLATYQVNIDGNPVDLTYLEYSLLAFLATHPGRTYSRDVLLRRVWGFEYYGGSRTVDVHVRRIRAKLGPEYADRLETVRGVGYLWNA